MTYFWPNLFRLLIPRKSYDDLFASQFKSLRIVLPSSHVKKAVKTYLTDIEEKFRFLNENDWIWGGETLRKV